MSEGTKERVRVRLSRSEIGGTRRQRETLRGLGLRKIGDVRELEKTDAVLGMIDKVRHLLVIDEPGATEKR